MEPGCQRMEIFLSTTINTYMGMIGKYHEDLCQFVNYLSGFSQGGFVFFYHRGTEPQKGSRTIDLNKNRGNPSFRSTPVQEKTNTFFHLTIKSFRCTSKRAIKGVYKK